MDEQKPVKCLSELDDFTATRNMDDYADRLWQQRVKTERESAESDDDTGSYSPTRENFYYDSYYTGEHDTFREQFSDYPLKRSSDDILNSPTASTPGVAIPTKRSRGRPYKEASVKITCLKPDDRHTNTLSVDFIKLQEEELGIPKNELVGGLRTSSKLPLTWSAEELRRYIRSLFPRVRTFTYMKCTQGKTLDPLPDDLKPSDLRNLLGRSGLYILPTGNLLPKGTTEPTSTVDPQESVTSSAASGPNTSTGSGSDQSAASPGKQYWITVKVDGEHVVNDDEEFRITLDVSSFSPDEITLKTKNSRVVVHAKHGERMDAYGIIEREFKRQYILPTDVDPNEVTSSLSANGILTLKAPKIRKDNSKERIIPIRFSV
ncbi:uncharacterized protein LOC127875388 isoform X2 [Dreissena polymorpha]|uniref:uncharacterized protein LOC127875388 isoform X2 n=1 Tax=Dreissena polymorpha TaxID=45954 RepID=UPI002264EC57|nr:uncharacterized protein LOC127875388 isoform X2 [Dreissena polymorpha]